MKWLIYKAFVVFFIFASPVLAQVSDSAETPLEKASGALEHLQPQEKLYLQFDKPYYAAGDIIWFRAYLLNAITHQPSELSKIVYVELINPADTLVKRLSLKKDQGNFNGSFELSDSIPAGNYRIRAYTNWMRNFGDEFFFTKDIMIGNRRLTNLQTHIEYEVNRGNDPPEVNAAIRFLDENDQPVAGKEVNYEYVQIGRHGTKGTATTGKDGYIHVKVPYNESSLYPNKYIRTSVNYDGLPFVKNFFLPSFKEEIDLQFFPEGGNLIAGVPNLVAFKAVDASGMGKEVEGSILDKEGNAIAEFQSSHRGMGKLVLNPLAGNQYTARLQLPGGTNKEYALPDVQEEGYLLNITPEDTVISVKIAASSARLRNRPIFLLGQTRGTPYYAAQAVLEKSLYQATIPASKFPSGITQFTLFDMDGIPVAERLVFINNGDQLDIDIQTGRQSYGARQKVMMKVQVTDSGGHPVQGEFSISVTDASVVKWKNEPGIRASLLLTSDLKGFVEDPAFYFDSANPEAEEAIDLLMLTQGWRRFEWQAILEGKPREINYPVELGFETRGIVYDDSGEPLPHAQMIMLAGSRKEGVVVEDTANAKGEFLFSGYEFPDSTRVLIQARNEKGRRHGTIEIQEDDPRIRFQTERLSPNVNDSIDAYLTMNKEAFTIEREKLGLSDILLSPVYVTAKRAPQSTGLHTYANNVITAEDISRMGAPVDILDVLRGRVPGLVVMGNRIIIRGISTFYGNTDPVVVVDGVRSMDAGILRMINPLDVASIEILKGANAAIYGMGSANGVIVINTKRGEYRPRGEYERRGIISFFPKGYHVVRKFYMPEYEVARNLRDKTPDLRTTIYWNGNVRTGSDGTASLSFFTADRPTNYTAIMEGVSEEGGIGHGESQIRVE